MTITVVIHTNKSLKRGKKLDHLSLFFFYIYLQAQRFTVVEIKVRKSLSKRGILFTAGSVAKIKR